MSVPVRVSERGSARLGPHRQRARRTHRQEGLSPSLLADLAARSVATWWRSPAGTVGGATWFVQSTPWLVLVGPRSWRRGGDRCGSGALAALLGLRRVQLPDHSAICAASSVSATSTPPGNGGTWQPLRHLSTTGVPARPDADPAVSARPRLRPNRATPLFPGARAGLLRAGPGPVDVAPAAPEPGVRRRPTAPGTHPRG